MVGLSMSKEQFRGLNTNKKLDVLFDNQLETMRLISGYKFYQKITAFIGGVIVIGMGVLFRFHIPL